MGNLIVIVGALLVSIFMLGWVVCKYGRRNEPVPPAKPYRYLPVPYPHEELIRAAREAMNLGDLDGAFIFLREAENQLRCTRELDHVRIAEVLMWRGVAFGKLGDERAAERELAMALSTVELHGRETRMHRKVLIAVRSFHKRIGRQDLVKTETQRIARLRRSERTVTTKGEHLCLVR